MPLKQLFDDANNDDDVVSKIEIDKEFAKRYEHNKKREALQRYEQLQKEGLVDESESGSESSSSDETDIKKTDVKFFDNLLKVKNRDPSLYSNVKLFESDGSDTEEEDIKDGNEKHTKKKPMYLKDVMARHLIEKGPELDDEEGSSIKTKRADKSYNDEQEELRKAFLDAVEDEEEDGEQEFLKLKERKNEEVSGDGNAADADGVEFEKKLGDYFGGEGELDEGSMFLRDFFKNKMWLGKDERDDVGEDEVDALLRDEEEVERQEKYEESYNFRYEESVGDRVLGHSRKVEGSVRKQDNSRKEQRKNKEERMKIAEMERKEELKHLKNLKKKEMKEKMKKVMEVAGFKDDNEFPLDLEDEFDPDEYDKMMKKAFDVQYYEAEDVEPGFGSDDDNDEMEKPDFDKEDELLGLPKDWDMIDSSDGFLAARERSLKLKQQTGNDCCEKEDGSGEERSEESKRKRKRKMSLVQKVKEEMMEEYYKLDYEGTIGDLKTRFKYAKVDPNKFGLKTEEILEMDDKELNQYVSIKKLAPYMDKEWKVPSTKKHQQKMMIRERLQEKSDKKNKTKHKKDKPSSVLGSKQDETEKLDESNVDTGNLSRKAKRRRRQAELKLSHPRLIAYGKVQS
ncbi:hypothetical protein POTOM_001021 [Populus tomentosa]|uniref:Kri1-like C-terminal domain-containing protein n=1 Tax=Populus tomentosa TaxID=118781 RepID=A0A8X8DH76_POPTO|nr:hypothetical protein POTOM_001021 [Populus tomentosa]